MIEVILLGCGATMPAPGRALSAAVLRCAGRELLFDCGEGTQTALRRERVSPLRIDLIALTHYHGDHIFGLPGLLQTMSALGRMEPLFVTGPEGLGEVLEPIARLAGELSFPLRALPAGALRLQELSAQWPRGAELRAFPTEHRVPSLGYAFSLERAPRFLPERAQALGVPMKLWKTLAAAAPDTPVLLDGEALRAEGRIVRASELQGPPRRGLRVVFSGDTRPCPALEKAAAGADLVLHDGTYGEDEQEAEAALWGHSTFRQAGELAARAGARRLWLTHFSQALTDPEAALPNAAQSFPAARCGFDGLRETLKFEEE